MLADFIRNDVWRSTFWALSIIKKISKVIKKLRWKKGIWIFAEIWKIINISEIWQKILKKKNFFWKTPYSRNSIYNIYHLNLTLKIGNSWLRKFSRTSFININLKKFIVNIFRFVKPFLYTYLLENFMS